MCLSCKYMYLLNKDTIYAACNEIKILKREWFGVTK